MKKVGIVGIVLGVILLFVLMVGMTFVNYYNRFISQGEAISAAWAQVENQLKRRNDLIPNLVNTVKGYMEHERGVFENIAEARAKLAGANTVSDKMKAYQGVEGALSRLLAIAENYPVLKANENFNKLMDELSGTENRIAVERMRYNDLVKIYNVSIKRFPGSFFASVFHKEAAAYFEVPEKEQVVPEVKF
ncbi:MAG: LemA family protein [bacterium]|nr:LemA family protein [bacterium]